METNKSDSPASSSPIALKFASRFRRFTCVLHDNVVDMNQTTSTSIYLPQTFGNKHPFNGGVSKRHPSKRRQDGFRNKSLGLCPKRRACGSMDNTRTMVSWTKKRRNFSRACSNDVTPSDYEFPLQKFRSTSACRCFDCMGATRVMSELHGYPAAQLGTGHLTCEAESRHDPMSVPERSAPAEPSALWPQQCIDALGARNDA
eukprot:332088-Amphidinium_carterae.1